MKDQLYKVKTFHEIFKLHVENEPAGKISKKLTHFRVRLLQEELDEYRTAAETGDIVAIADALTDMLYVLLGTYITHGLQDIAEELFDEVHRSNMSKLNENRQPIYRGDGKVLKSELFSQPDLDSIISSNSEQRSCICS